MNKSFKIILVIAGCFIICYLSFKLVAGISLFGLFEKRYSVKDVINNYNKNEKHINKLVMLLDSGTARNKAISFGLGQNNNFYNIGIALPNGRVEENTPNFGGSNIRLHSQESDSILTVLHWNGDFIKELSDALKESDCKNIMSGDPIRLEYRNTRNGIYRYLIFKEELPDSVIKRYGSQFGDSAIRKNVVVILTSSF